MDIACYDDNAKMFRKALDGGLFAVATDDENTGRLRKCFREARELVESASGLLGCPRYERERYAAMHYLNKNGVVYDPRRKFGVLHNKQTVLNYGSR